MDPTDETLIEEIRRAPPGDTRSFEELVRRHQGRVLANCRYLTGSPEDAEDLAQEVFARVYVSLQQFEGRSQFKTWLHRVKVNHCLKFLRKKRPRFVDVNEAALEADPALQVASRDAEQLSSRELVRRLLEAMPEGLRVPLILRDLDGLAYEDIGKMLGLGSSATKMRIKRAREWFRDQLREREGMTVQAKGRR